MAFSDLFLEVLYVISKLLLESYSLGYVQECHKDAVLQVSRDGHLHMEIVCISIVVADNPLAFDLCFVTPK